MALDLVCQNQKKFQAARSQLGPHEVCHRAGWPRGELLVAGRAKTGACSSVVPAQASRGSNMPNWGWVFISACLFIEPVLTKPNFTAVYNLF